jgi:hypothetical protein
MLEAFKDLIKQFDSLDMAQLLKGFLGLSFMSWVAYKLSLFAGIMGALWVAAELYEDFWWMFEPEGDDDPDDEDDNTQAPA